MRGCRPLQVTPSSRSRQAASQNRRLLTARTRSRHQLRGRLLDGAVKGLLWAVTHGMAPGRGTAGPQAWSCAGSGHRGKPGNCQKRVLFGRFLLMHLWLHRALLSARVRWETPAAAAAVGGGLGLTGGLRRGSAGAQARAQGRVGGHLAPFSGEVCWHPVLQACPCQS